MGRPAALSAEKKERIVLEVLSGRTTAAQAARDSAVSPAAVAAWKRQFLDAGRAGLQRGTARDGGKRLAALQAQNDALRTALRETLVLTRVWRISAQAREAFNRPSQIATPQAASALRSSARDVPPAGAR